MRAMPNTVTQADPSHPLAASWVDPGSTLVLFVPDSEISTNEDVNVLLRQVSQVTGHDHPVAAQNSPDAFILRFKTTRVAHADQINAALADWSDEHDGKVVTWVADRLHKGVRPPQ